MSATCLNLSIVRMKDQQTARVTVPIDNTFKDMILELERSGFVEASANPEKWVFINKYNDECYRATNEAISNYPIKNNGTLYILDTPIVTIDDANKEQLRGEIERLERENQSLRKAINILTSNL